MTSSAAGIVQKVKAMLRGPGFRAIVARGGSMVAAFAMTVVITRSMPDQDSAGLVFLVYTLTIVAANVGRIGADNLALREVSKQTDRTPAIIRHTVRVVATFAPLAMLLLIVAVWLESLEHEGLLLGIVASLAVLPIGLSVLAGAVLRGLGRIAAGTVAELGSAPLIASVGMLVVWYFGRASVPLHVAMIVLGFALTAIWSWALVIKTLPAVKQRTGGFPAFFREFRGSLIAFFTASLGFLLFTWLPTIVLGYFSSTGQVAVYNVGARLAAFVGLIPTIQISYLSQQFASLYHQGRVDEVNSVAQRATRQALLTAGVLALVLVLFPEYVLQLFGNGYTEAAPVLRVLALGALVVAALGPVYGLMLTVGLEKAAGRITATLVATSLVALPLLATQGAIAVALGSQAIAIAYAVACTVVLARRGLYAVLSPRGTSRRA